jgi:hypothetical protein
MHAAAASGKGIFISFIDVQFSLDSLAFLLPNLSPLFKFCLFLFNLGLCNLFLRLGLGFYLLVLLCLSISNSLCASQPTGLRFNHFNTRKTYFTAFLRNALWAEGETASFDRRLLLTTPGLKPVERPRPSASLLNLLPSPNRLDVPLLDPSLCEISLQLQVVSPYQPQTQLHGLRDSLEGRGGRKTTVSVEELNCVHVGAFHPEQLRSGGDFEEISVSY